MARFKLMASVSWIAGSDIDFGEDEFESEEEAEQAAYEYACERLDAWAELVADDA